VDDELYDENTVLYLVYDKVVDSLDLVSILANRHKFNKNLNRKR
jgi:hypothetical protein